MFKCFKKKSRNSVKPIMEYKVNVWENKEKIKEVRIDKPKLVKLSKKDSFLLYD